MLLFWIIIGVLLAGVLIVSFVAYRMSFYNANATDNSRDVMGGEGYDQYHDQMVAMIETAIATPCRDVWTTSREGLKLHGRLYERENMAGGRRTVHIMVHGWRGAALRDFCGGMHLALNRNETLLLIDQRAHGKSEGHTLTFGIKERYDVLRWIDFALQTYGPDTIVFLEGISMGAATVLMTADLPLPPNVHGIWADCPYASPMGILSTVANRMVPIPGMLNLFIVVGAALFAHVNVFAAAAQKAVKNTKVPITLIHGTGDQFVPFDNSLKIAAANPARVSLVEIADAAHAVAYVYDPEKYTDAFNRFIDNNQ